MTTYNTGNPLGSVDVRDLYDNAQNADNFSNGPLDAYPDRFGVSRQSLQGIRNASQYQVLGPYAAGLVFTQANQVFSYLGEFYAPGPSITLPYTTTGAGAGEIANFQIANFRSVGDAVLRQALAATDGASLVGYGAGTVEDALDDVAGLADDVAALQVIAAEYVRPETPADGIADDTAAFLAALNDGRPVYLGDDSKIYRLTEEVAFTAARSVVIHSDGAKIIVDSPSSIRSAIRIDLAGHGLYVSGRLFLDCQNKAYSGFYATNYGAAIAKADVLCSGLEVSNCHRTATTFTGGDGIFIGGNLYKLRVVDCSARNIHMAAGAGVSGAQGVSGITISRDNTNELDASLITVEGCEIGPVYSDDVAYTGDQDGLRVFTMYDNAGINPRQVGAVVNGCRFVNCHGRAIKIQTEWASVDNVKIERTDAIYGGGYIGNTDIDFQVGGGQVSNIQCQYRSNFPTRVMNFTLTRDDSRVNQTCAQVVNASVVQSGTGSGFERFVAVTTEFDAIAQVSLSGVSVLGTRVPIYMLTLQSKVAAGLFAVNVGGMVGRASTAFVQRLGAVLTPCFITGTSIINQGASVTFAQAAAPGDFTVSLLGANRLVT